MASENELVKREIQTPGKLFVRESAPGEAPSRKICGYAIMFNVPSVILDKDDHYEEREVIKPCAVTKELLDGCDILMTMYHNREIVLARSNKGEGTLSYRIDNKGVFFEFDAPNSPNGDEALELVRRGDITGCSFIFGAYYYDEEYVRREEKKVNGVTQVTCYVLKMTGVYDFTITTKPAYPDTSVEAREAQERKAQKKAREIREIRERTGHINNQAKKKTKAEEIQEIRNKVRIAETLLK
jgi:HK97 family phage prohead protease